MESILGGYVSVESDASAVAEPSVDRLPIGSVSELNQAFLGDEQTDGPPEVGNRANRSPPADRYSLAPSTPPGPKRHPIFDLQFETPSADGATPTTSTSAPPDAETTPTGEVDADVTPTGEVDVQPASTGEVNEPNPADAATPTPGPSHDCSALPPQVPSLPRFAFNRFGNQPLGDQDLYRLAPANQQLAATLPESSAGQSALTTKVKGRRGAKAMVPKVKSDYFMRSKRKRIEEDMPDSESDEEQ